MAQEDGDRRFDLEERSDYSWATHILGADQRHPRLLSMQAHDGFAPITARLFRGWHAREMTLKGESLSAAQTGGRMRLRQALPELFYPVYRAGTDCLQD
ncbi:hypothetical protein HIM_06655 [Hirsutella minnesotensis 3608]|uniref:Uncharacterized protein n=1 Tax=Hirsutella minnesotensis 3608 TaxID=1043627 RepID=A0A0F7ZZC6_9HYPO|nr:hypothetical protein HIM_06655 [Hirsutella minnesotensis 3608]